MVALQNLASLFGPHILLSSHFGTRLMQFSPPAQIHPCRFLSYQIMEMPK